MKIARKEDPRITWAMREMQIVTGALLLDDDANKADPDRENQVGILASCGYVPGDVVVGNVLGMLKIAAKHADPHAQFAKEKAEVRDMVLSGAAADWAALREGPKALKPNIKCPCGSGLKFKKCCSDQYQELEGGIVRG